MIRKILNGLKQLRESGYTRIINIMRGAAPNIKTFGIMTAFNPGNTELPREENNKLNRRLEEYLRSGNYGFIKGKSEFNKFERPFFIPNITQNELLQAGGQFKQESVIFGEAARAYNGMTIKLIYCDKGRKGKIQSEVKIFKHSADDKFYSEFKGRKFQIPFFDDDFKDFEFQKGAGVIHKSAVYEGLKNKFNGDIEKLFEKKRSNTWFIRGRTKLKVERIRKILNSVVLIEKNLSPQLTSKMWILPDGKIEAVGGMFHHEWLLDNYEQLKKKYGAMDFSGINKIKGEELRWLALINGMFRVNYERKNGQLTVEGMNDYFSDYIKTAVFNIVSKNKKHIGAFRITLFSKNKEIVNDEYAQLFHYDDNEKTDYIPLISRKIKQKAEAL